jgi:hypothetical protein
MAAAAAAERLSLAQQGERGRAPEQAERGAPAARRACSLLFLLW